MKDPYVFFPVLTVANVFAFFINIFISSLWNKIFAYRVKTPKDEFTHALRIVFLNIVIAIPGFIFWHKGFIKFSNSGIAISFLSLFFLLDFLMYTSHYVTHNITFPKRIHQKHHEHTEKFNTVSLFYMSLGESLLFGILLTLVVFVFSFNIYGFILFLIFNWFYGVIAHLNTTSNKQNFFIFTTSSYHKNHHILHYKNYGFYTYLWDKIFGTHNNIK